MKRLWVLEELLKMFIGAGAVTSLVQFGRRVGRGKTLSNRLIGLRRILRFCYMFPAYLVISESYLEPISLNYIFLPAVWAFGPLWILGYRALGDESFRMGLAHRLYFAPMLTIACLLPIWEILGLPMDPNPLANYFERGQFGLFEFLLVFGLIFSGIILLGIGIRTRGFVPESWRKSKTIKFTRLFLLISGYGVSVLVFGSLILQEVKLLFGAMALVSIMQHFWETMRQIHPELSQIAPEVAKSLHYKRTRLAGLDLAGVEEALTRLIEKERLFLQERLTVDELASMLDLKDYQLREFLNTHMKMNFPTLMNYYRVREAGKLLKEDRQASILSVAFQVGFNSKATFNSAFKQQMGMTPREFVRKNHG